MYYDALTGLPNRASARAPAAELVEARREGRPVALLLLDLDRFRQVNNTLGSATATGSSRRSRAG